MLFPPLRLVGEAYPWPVLGGKVDVAVFSDGAPNRADEELSGSRAAARPVCHALLALCTVRRVSTVPYGPHMSDRTPRKDPIYEYLLLWEDTQRGRCACTRHLAASGVCRYGRALRLIYLQSDNLTFEPCASVRRSWASDRLERRRGPQHPDKCRLCDQCKTTRRVQRLLLLLSCVFVRSGVAPLGSLWAVLRAPAAFRRTME